MFLEIKNLKKFYGNGENRVEVLKGIDLGIEKGEFCVLLGPSGSGKSTLLNILGGIDQADAGSIIIAGEPMETMKEKQLTDYRRRHLGYVFQMYNLIPNLTVRENIEVGAYLGEKPLDVDELLHTLGLYEHQGKRPNQATKDVEIPDYVEIQADATDFQLDFTATVVTNGLFKDLEEDDLKDLDDLKDSSERLQDASNKLIDGAGQLLSGSETLQSYIKQYTDGVKAVDQGIGTLQSGVAALKENTAAQAGLQAVDWNGVEQSAEDKAKEQVTAATKAALENVDGLSEEEKTQIAEQIASKVDLDGITTETEQQIQTANSVLSKVPSLENAGDAFDGLGQIGTLADSIRQLSAGSAQLKEGVMAHF